jgi:lipopolysaccharide biosynthesis glycosyltransferase
MLDVLKANDVKTKVVPKLTSTGNPLEWYKHMVTKYALWAMVEYDQIAYYDSDHVYLKSPENIFNDCGDHPFCAVQDVGIEGRYLNAGCMVIHPNLTMFQHIKDLSYLANSKTYAEQDQFNIMFKDKWKELNEIYNMQWVERHPEKLNNPDGVSVHEKYWRFKLMGMDDPKYIWNQLKSQFTFKSTFDFAFPAPK